MPTLAATAPWSGAKATVVATIVLVFLAGTVVGGVAMSWGGHSLHKEPFWTPSGKQISVDKLTRELELSPDQVEQLQVILDDFAKYYRTVLSEGKARLYHILNEQQRKKLDRLMSDKRR
jgi:hypothetical protein